MDVPNFELNLQRHSLKVIVPSYGEEFFRFPPQLQRTVISDVLELFRPDAAPEIVNGYVGDGRGE